MTLKAQIILLVVLLLALAAVVNTVRKGKLQLKYALPWLACVVALGILCIVPQSIEALAALLGIQSPVNMVFFLGFVFSLAIIFVLTAALSRLTMRLRQLAQAVALMEHRAATDRAERAEEAGKEKQDRQ